MSDGRPGRRPGTPSPNKKYWVITVKGVFVRFEWPGNLQLPNLLPTYFENAKSAGIAAQLLNGGAGFIAVISPVTRKWLELLARGEKPEVKVETFPTSVPIAHLR